MRLLSCLVAMILSGSTYGQTIVVPANTQAEIGDLVEIKVGGDCPKFKWKGVKAANGLRLKNLPPSVMVTPGFIVVTAPAKSGVYELDVFGSNANGPSEIVTATVTVVDPNNPTPPGPAPVPVPPAPVDDLTKTVMIAWAADSKAGSTQTDLANLTALYKTAQDFVLMDKTLATLGDVKNKLVNASILLKLGPPPPDGKILAGVRTAIGVELDRSLSTVTAEALTDDSRTKIVAAFKRVQTALESCK